MVTQWMSVGLFSAGVVIGIAIAELRPALVLSAQGSWQCRSWTLGLTDDVDALGPWLGTTSRVEISTAGLDAAGQYVLVACKQ